MLGTTTQLEETDLTIDSAKLDTTTWCDYSGGEEEAVMENGNGMKDGVGGKYNRDLSIVEIAKRVRADLKMAVKSGEIPNAKFGVRIARFAGGRSLDVKIGMNGVDLIGVLNPVHAVVFNRFHDYLDGHYAPRHTPEGERILAAVAKLVAAYNFDHSDSMTDYFHVNFYGSVEFASDVQDFDRGQALAQYDAGVAVLGKPEVSFNKEPYGAVDELEKRIRVGASERMKVFSEQAAVADAVAHYGDAAEHLPGLALEGELVPGFVGVGE